MESRLEKPSFKKRELELEEECKLKGCRYEQATENETPYETKKRRERIRYSKKNPNSKSQRPPSVYECITDVRDRNIVVLPTQQQQQQQQQPLNQQLLPSSTSPLSSQQLPPSANPSTTTEYQQPLPSPSPPQQQQQLPRPKRISKATPPRRCSKRISKVTPPRRCSKRILTKVTPPERVRQVNRVYFRSKTLQSIIEKEGLDKAVDKVLSDLFLHPFRKPSVGGMEGIVISFNSAYGNPLRSNIDRLSYGRQSYSLSCCDNQQRRRSDRLRFTRNAFVYGAGSGASSFGDSPTQMTCREMSTEMNLIRIKLQELMRETFAGDDSVNTDVILNTCEVIFYYNEKKIPYHRDMTYYRSGHYIHKRNSQVHNTPVVILAVGDTRELEFALHNYDGKRQQDKPKIIKLEHGTVFMLHPKDEEDLSRIIKGVKCNAHFRHKSRGVKGRQGSLSIGFVFRCTKSCQLVNKFTGQYIINKSEKSQREMLFDKKLEDYFEDTSLKDYHEEFLQKLYIDMRDKFIKK